jgi:acyl-CoA thioester hydrolase
MRVIRPLGTTGVLSAEIALLCSGTGTTTTEEPRNSEARRETMAPNSATPLDHPRGRWLDGWYVAPHHVVFRDLDAFGHVNNAVFFSYFEWARALYWFELFGWRGAGGIDFIVARAECDFRKQLDLEPVELAVRVGEMRTSSFTFHQEIRKVGGEVAASGKVVVVLYDWARQSKVPLPDDLRRKIAECSLDVS